MTTVTAVLHVDLDNIRARYECFVCHGKEGPVFGPEDVKAFTAVIRNDHRARCTADAPPQGGHR